MDPFSAVPRRPHLGVGVGVGAKARTTIGRDASLSDLLYSERPLLRPVKFVRATLTPFLFQHSEEVLKPALQAAADTTKTSHVPTAERVARLFHENVPDSDSESDDQARDALEEIDFADLAKVRAEVDAIAQKIATMDRDAHEDQEDIEEVDFADLAAMRAKVDAMGLQGDSRDDIIQGAFTGVYNQIKETTQASSTMDVVDDDQPRGVQQPASLSPSPALGGSLDLEPSIEISNLSSNHEAFTHTRDTIVVEEEAPRSPNALPSMLVEESPLSTAPETRPVSAPADGVPFHPDTPYDDPHPLFIVDTAPTCPFTSRSASDIILVDRTGHSETLGDQDEERIVYVAPHPRSGRASPVPAVPRVKLPQTSLLTGKSVDVGGLKSPIREDDAGPDLDLERTRSGLEVGAGEDQQLSLASLSLGPTASTSTSSLVHPLKARKEVRLQRRNKRGAMVSEARLRDEDAREKRHPRWETRRRGDSDVDWGTEDENEDGEGEEEDEDGMDAVSNGLGGMEIDPDLVMDVNAMQGFLKSMSAEGSRFVTMDDIEDEARMQQEDEVGQGGPEGSSDSERSDDEEVEVDSEDDEEFIAHINVSRGSIVLKLVCLIATGICHKDLLEKNSQILSGRDRKQKKAVFRNLHQGHVDAEAFIDEPEFTTPVNKKSTSCVFLVTCVLELKPYTEEKKGKGKQTAELEARWAKDRAKKAEYKRQRLTARLLAALDPLSADVDAETGDGRTRAQTSRKAMAAAARLDPSAALSVAPRAIVDMASLEAQVRRFVEDAGGRTSMALPPMEKEMRKRVHEMAGAFGVKSMSKGKGKGRYTTLIKTTRTRVNEGKVRGLMKRYGGGKGRGVPRHREGDEVGKEAPKIGENNVGFKMLASMGWSEGGRIGGTASVGIEAPLVAIIKNSKLGLGATR
ncbi:hypothetical protein J3R83DRAFT_3752 [Lanmaoa asiatica]|nr:hypothetical protein J3R83DRAFT_3752 [Lanmaoa asiatica]